MGIEAVTVEFPLRGEWEAEHTPAEKVPSHGTDQLAQTYAYDFVRIGKDRMGLKFFRGPLLRYLIIGVTLEDCYGWSEPIYAPFAGRVTAAKDGWPERRRLHLLRDLAVVLKNALAFDPKRDGDLRPILGNYLILKMTGQDTYAFFAHARCGSVRVQEGDEVGVGQQLAAVGHSGNSTAPHLHFQLMNGDNILAASGVPCRFREYEALRGGVWCKVINGIPGKREFIRSAVPMMPSITTAKRRRP